MAENKTLLQCVLDEIENACEKMKGFCRIGGISNEQYYGHREALIVLLRVLKNSSYTDAENIVLTRLLAIKDQYEEIHWSNARVHLVHLIKNLEERVAGKQRAIVDMISQTQD